jgi:hypothetical protein
MITMCDNKPTTETVKPIIVSSGLGATKVGAVNLIPVWHGWQNGRMWIWFPLVMESEVFGKTLPAEWMKVYPRVIQFSDGKYYSFAGTHSAIPEYRIKGDNTVYYKEILVENGERVEYI